MFFSHFVGAAEGWEGNWCLRKSLPKPQYSQKGALHSFLWSFILLARIQASSFLKLMLVLPTCKTQGTFWQIRQDAAPYRWVGKLSGLWVRANKISEVPTKDESWDWASGQGSQSRWQWGRWLPTDGHTSAGPASQALLIKKKVSSWCHSEFNT